MGSLARDTLAYLAAHRPDLSPTIHRAVAMMSDPLAGPSRFDPLSIGVGLMVVLALQSDVHLERVSKGKWRFTPHKKALSDTALPTLLSKCLNTYTAGGS